MGLAFFFWGFETTVTKLDVRKYKWYGQCASRDCEPLEEFVWVFASFSVAIFGVLLWNSPFFLQVPKIAGPADHVRCMYIIYINVHYKFSFKESSCITLGYSINRYINVYIYKCIYIYINIYIYI